MTLSSARWISSIFSRFVTSDERFAMSRVEVESTSSSTRSLLVLRVLPELERSTSASAIPRWGVASQAPPTRTIVTGTCRFEKYCFVMTGNSVAIFAPLRSLMDEISESSRMASTSFAFPIWRSRSSPTSDPRSTTISWPVMPRSAAPVATYSGISMGRANRISTWGSSVRAISRRSAMSGRWSPLFSIRSIIGAAILPLLGMASRIMPEKAGGSAGAAPDLFVPPCFFLESFEFATDYLLRDAGHVREVVIDNCMDLAVDFRESYPFPRQHLDACHEGEIDRFSDLGEQPDVHLLDTVNLFDRFLRDPGREKVIDLTDVIDGVLTARGLHAHRAVGGDKPVAPVAPADRAVVTHLCRCTGDGQKHALVFDIVRGVDMHHDLAFRAFLCNLPDLFGEESHVVLVFFNVRTVRIDNGAGDSKRDGISVTQAHDLDVLPYCGI